MGYVHRSPRGWVLLEVGGKKYVVAPVEVDRFVELVKCPVEEGGVDLLRLLQWEISGKK